MSVMLRPGTTIGDRYVIDGAIARGGMADVYRATDRAMGRSVALKALRSGAADVRRFESEMRLLAMLKHPNLVRLLDAGHEAGVPYLVLELIDGETLARRLERGPLAPAAAARVGRDIADALTYVHGRDVVHRDIKPSNILLAEDGRALLSDLGAARVSDASRLTASGTAIGTAAYLAPEQAGGTDVGSPADIYALGLVLIEALTGGPAFAGTPAELLAQRLSSEPEIPASIPEPWPRLLATMTRRNPAARPKALTVGRYLEASRRSSAGGDAIPLDPTVVAREHARDEAETAELTLPMAADDRTRRLPPGRPTPPPSDEPAIRFALWSLVAVAALLVVGLMLAFDTGADDQGDAAGDASPPTTTTIVQPSTTAVTLGTTAPSPTEPVQAEPAVGSQADVCAALGDRKQALDAAKQQVEETYRQDRETRERLKAEIDAEKQAINTQRQNQDC